MSTEFSEYLDSLDREHPHREALESSYREAGRLMSPRGLDNYLEGLHAICTLGRGEDLEFTYLQEMPGVAKEVGEDVIPDVVHALMKLASHTSGTVITLLIANLPLAAQRLGDADVLRGFLSLIHQLAGKAPRGLRPMMENLDELLAKLTLGGLRRWAMWGAQAHQRDLDGQIAYFGLTTESSKAVLQKERRGTLFVDNHRKLNFYLRALWARSFFIRPTSGDYETREGLRPFVEGYEIHVPDAFDQLHDISGLEAYRAAVAHCAAHMVYTNAPLSAEQLSPAQMKMIELFEDARIEYLAIGEFPGLAKLWGKFFDVHFAADIELHPSVEFMVRMARVLLDPASRDQEADLNSFASTFRSHLVEDAQDNQISWDAGMEFYHWLSRHSAIPSLRVLDEFPIAYRDDNRYVWMFSETDFSGTADALTMPKQVRRSATVMEMVNELDCELAGDDAQEIWTLSTPFWLDQEDCTINELEGKEPVSDPYHYPEWDYRVQLFRPDWVTVIERRQPKSDPARIDSILDKYKPLAHRIRHLVDVLQPQGIVRRRGYEEGDEIDLNAAVRAFIDIRRGIMPDPRINIRITRHIRDLAVLVLMDLSESTNERVDKHDESSPTVLEVTCEATGLLAWAIDCIGDPFALHGFASDGRHDVQYFRFKDFDQPYDEDAKSRLAGTQGGLSTRMGAALRHAGWHLEQQPSARKLVLLVTDGEPADIDERDPQYLRHDAKKAVEDLATRGIYTYCLTLDAEADRYVEQIFGTNRYSVVDHVERLPERLPAVFAAVTG
ncbi:MAG: VWA domain-containing protein [Gammaproteobacteria bacterium]|nr:VWA domain-containing protein [Gammaproteobacteria bacterium]